MKRLEISGAIRLTYKSLGVKGLSYPNYVTTAQDGGKVSALRTGRLYPQEILLVLILQKAGWPQGRSGRAENIVRTGIRSPTLQPIVSRYTD
jgi:hypothetical protein